MKNDKKTSLNVYLSDVSFVVCKYGKLREAWARGTEKDIVTLLTDAMNASKDIKRVVVKALAATMNAKSINQPKKEGENDNA